MPGSREDEIMHFLHGYISKTSAPGLMKLKVLVDYPLVIIAIYMLNLTYQYLEVERKIFKEIMHFHYMTTT